MSASLAALQRRFLAAVLDEAPIADRIDPDDGLAFYRGSIEANQCAALACTFPAVERLVGATFFGEAARRYARSRPSLAGDLHRFGDAFAEFLDGYAPAASLAYLPDVARLEWAVHECARAADAAPFDFAALAAVREDLHGRLRATLAPAVHRMESRHPVLAIWEANAPDRDGMVDPGAGPDRVLIRRVANDVVVERLDPPSWRLMQALAHGASLEEASEALEDEAGRFPGLLAQWISHGVIAALVPDEARA